MREFLNAKTVVIAEEIEQTEIRFEPAHAETSGADREPANAAVDGGTYDADRFREAFRTALTDTADQPTTITDPPRGASRISGFRGTISGVRDPK
jgi:hypothetical protein